MISAFLCFFFQVLYLVRDRPNICSHLHMPAQSGSSVVLAAMRRGYSREAYLDLISHVRQIVPGELEMMQHIPFLSMWLFQSSVKF